MKYFKYVLMLIASSVLYNCSSVGADSSNENNFDVDALLADAVISDIVPAANNFLSEVKTLDIAVNSFIETLDSESLLIAQEQWKIAALSYADNYAFNIGEVRDKYLNFSLYNWPTLPTAIENVVLADDEITESKVSSLSSQIKTLSTLEYLLFSKDNETLLSDFSNSKQRRNYLKYVSSNLEDKATQLTEIWGDYGTTFVENEATGIDSSFNLFYNGIYNLIDTGKVTKIGKPAGLENSSNTDPEITQAFYSHSSLAILRRNILSVKNVYFKTNGLGISDYVQALLNDDVLNTAIDIKITEVIAAIDAIPTNLFDAITENKDEVKILHEKIGELKVLFGVDVQSVLSITITSTDNDGD